MESDLGFGEWLAYLFMDPLKGMRYVRELFYVGTQGIKISNSSISNNTTLLCMPIIYL